MANSKNCNIVADAIEQSSSYDQECYTNACGTPACVAGHAVMALDKKFIKFGETGEGTFYYRRGLDNKPKRKSIDSSARRLLGLNMNQGSMLFGPNPLPGKIVTQQMAASVLRLLARHQIIRWERFQ